MTVISRSDTPPDADANVDWYPDDDVCAYCPRFLIIWHGDTYCPRHG